MVDLDDNTLLDLHIYSDLTQPHLIIIIHLKYFIQEVLSTIDGKFTQVRITLLASPSANSGYKGIFSRADILQIAVANATSFPGSLGCFPISGDILCY